MCEIQIFLSNQRRIWYCTWKDQNRHGFLRQDVKHISLNIPQYTAIINKYKQSPFPADSEWKRAGEKKKKKVCICFLYNFGMHSGFTPGSREREAEDAILIRISRLKRVWIFSSTLSTMVSWPWEQDIFRSTLMNSEGLFCRWRDEGQFSRARGKLTHCILRRWHRREGGLSWRLFTCRCIALNGCGACSTALPAPARRLIMHEVPEAHDSHFTFDVTDASLRWQSCLILGILANPVAVCGYFS